MPALKGNNVLITGASRGIGRALAYEFAEHGYNLYLLARDDNALGNIASELSSKNVTVHYTKCDVGKKEDVSEAIKDFRNKFETLDLAIFNAAAGISIKIDESKSEDMEKVIQTNLVSYFYFFEEIVPIMVKQRHGIIAGVSSLADSRGYPNSSVYCASKAAVSTFLESSRVELEKFNIRVITVKPGFVRTDMTAKNKFYMPFFMEPKKAAGIIYRGILKGRSIVQFPAGTVFLNRVVKFLPNWFYDWVIKKLKKIDTD